ncbi:MAG: peptidoglycan DD-metalloendopeptidase family protein [Burkholderiaceae bacterium]|nr:peptidoglycan DD-metalloendopeptidase family protein [Burkholderiaceae bacterium]
MTIVRAGFARGEAIAALPRRCIAVAAVLVLAGCASPHPAPIVHRSSPPAPVAAQPAPAPSPAPASVAAAGAAGAAAAPGAEVTGVQTTPIARGPVEARPLPGAGGALPAPSNSAAGNLLKTEPKALKQPYSDAALAQMRANAPAATEPMPPIASAAPSAAAARPPAGEAAAASAAAAASSAAAASASAGAGTGSDWIWPASGQVVQDFAQPSSMGISIAGKPGDPIVAVNDGRVIFSGAGPRSYGNLVIVKHGDDTLSVYAHNRTLLVKEGQSVKRGQRIAELGSSGTDGPKLHFEIRRDGRPIDPRKVLPAR